MLKLKLNNPKAGSSQPTPPETASPTATTTPDPPVAASTAKPKLKLTNNKPSANIITSMTTPKTKSTPSVVSASTPSWQKKPGARRRKPSQKQQKIDEDKNRADSPEADESTIAVQQPRHPQERQSSILKLNVNKRKGVQATKKANARGLKLKSKGKPPVKPPGEGYDSEASDIEIDPAIEEDIILRLPQGDPNCDVLRKAINEKKIAALPELGGKELEMKWFSGGRRAVVLFNGSVYPAVLVNMPTITEAYKSFDNKKGIYKSADVNQMLLCFAKVETESQARSAVIPPSVDPSTFAYPHGITPPMRNARERFRERPKGAEIENIEEQVEKLLAKDEKAQNVKLEWVDPEIEAQRKRAESSISIGIEEGDADAEGEEDTTMMDDAGGGIDINDLEAEMEAGLAEASKEVTTPGSVTIATPSQVVETPTQVTEEEEEESDEDSGDESVEGEEEVDPEKQAKLDKIAVAKEDIADLEKQLDRVQGQLTIQANPILRKKLEESIKKLKAELQLKKSALEGDDA